MTETMRLYRITRVPDSIVSAAGAGYACGWRLHWTGQRIDGEESEYIDRASALARASFWAGHSDGMDAARLAEARLRNSEVE